MQQMNVNEPETLTEENVAALLASKDDSVHRQLRVLDDGSVILSDDVGLQRLQGVRARWETWCSGNGNSGLEASKSARWVGQILSDLRDVVPKNLKGYIEV